MHQLLIENALRNKQIIDSIFATHEKAQIDNYNTTNLVAIPKQTNNILPKAFILVAAGILVLKGVEYYQQWKKSNQSEG